MYLLQLCYLSDNGNVRCSKKPKFAAKYGLGVATTHLRTHLTNKKRTPCAVVSRILMTRQISIHQWIHVSVSSEHWGRDQPKPYGCFFTVERVVEPSEYVACFFFRCSVPVKKIKPLEFKVKKKWIRNYQNKNKFQRRGLTVVASVQSRSILPYQVPALRLHRPSRPMHFDYLS